MPEINGKQWTKKQVHKALKEDRAGDIWPGAVFSRLDETGVTVTAAKWDGHYGVVTFTDGERIRFNFDPNYKG